MAKFLLIFLSLSSFLAVFTNVSAHSITTSTNDGIVDQWQTANLQIWPPLYTFQQPQQLQQQQPPQAYFLLNQPLLQPVPVLPQPQPTSTAQLLPQPMRSAASPKIKKSKMVPSKIRDIEPTTARSINEREFLRRPKPARLEQLEEVDEVQDEEENPGNVATFTNDPQLLAAVRRINPEFVIEEVVRIPGKHILSISENEAAQKPATAANLKKFAKFQIKKQKKSAAALQKNRSPAKLQNGVPSQVVVESTGRTATSGVIPEIPQVPQIPQIPFGAYFLPYYANAPATFSGGVEKTAALILEPHSKAVVGNGGTAVSMPLSRALLKRGRPTNVYFNPESVAIAGVGGKAHAAADLVLDLIN